MSWQRFFRNRSVRGAELPDREQVGFCVSGMSCTVFSIACAHS